MDLQLAGKVVLVTGAGQGLGRALGLAFAAEGAMVAFHYHSSEAGAEEAAQQTGGLAAPADPRDDTAVEAAVAAVEERLGPVDVFVNNAAATRRARFLDWTPAEWEEQISVTVTGTLLVTHAVARRMAARG